jgi:hypothetical protein
VDHRTKKRTKYVIAGSGFNCGDKDLLSSAVGLLPGGQAVLEQMKIPHLKQMGETTCSPTI